MGKIIELGKLGMLVTIVTENALWWKFHKPKISRNGKNLSVAIWWQI